MVSVDGKLVKFDVSRAGMVKAMEAKRAANRTYNQIYTHLPKIELGELNMVNYRSKNAKDLSFFVLSVNDNHASTQIQPIHVFKRI